GGSGYAWYEVEGEIDGTWLPIPDIDLLAEDEQGNIIQCQANILPFQFLTAPFHFQNAGVFCVPIDANIIGSGNPGDQETITVISANGETISPANQQIITAKVVPYLYSVSWGYRIYAKGGAGVTAGVITATGFVGGGSGAKIEIVLEGLDTNPDWSNFKIYRRDDIFVGAEVKLGPPTLIDIGLGASASVNASFPYQHEFEFDLDELEGLEALIAFYLFAEPSVIYAPGLVPGGQITVNFLSWVVETLIENSAQNGLGIARVADEAGLDIEGNLDFSVDILENIPLGLKMGPSLGAHAHLGGSKRVTEDGEINRRLYIGGGYDASIGIGPKFISDNNFKSEFIYPFRLNQTLIPSSLEVNFEYLGTWQNSDWQHTKLSAALASNSSELNIYDLPGQIQEYSAWLKIDDTDLKNILLNITELPSEMWNIGSAAVDVITDNESCKEDFVDFLGVVYDEQNDDLPVQLEYGFDAEDKSEYNIDLDLEFPLPVFPAIVITLGGGLEATNSRSYELSNGYWVKGLPYLQTEMPNPPQPGETFVGVMTELWDNVTSGNVLDELVDVILSHLGNTFFGWLGKSETQIVELNDKGSTLTINENSIPTGVDSVLCRNWEWYEEPENPTLTFQQKQRIKEYNIRLRQVREEAMGLRYGIGGFFKFEPEGEFFGDSTLISIAYADSEVIDINESDLSIYWEDDEGNWNQIPSQCYPDSNKVKAWISNFVTYTIAPRLPQGSFGFYSIPDSIPADGISTAIITSETLYNNDSTVVENGEQFTLSASRPCIITSDCNPDLAGVQVEVFGGTIQFEVQADSVALPIHLSATSVSGFAMCEMDLPLYDVSIPDTPSLISVLPEHKSLHIIWEQVNNPDIAGYKIWFDTDSTGVPYNGSANYPGVPSPVILGNCDEYYIEGLVNDTTYYVAITAFDISGSSSTYSNELTGIPSLQPISEISIEIIDEGVKINWQSVHNANSYKVYRGIEPDMDIINMDLVNQTTSTSWIDTSALGVDKYFYRVVVVAY
ncbi:MAG: hypothetical protein H8D22_08295, partial [Candidatus Cloacimonetes bacterium]|nr:hypothetical protein [Candidatus Cloacimonadota bacterium]